MEFSNSRFLEPEKQFPVFVSHEGDFQFLRAVNCCLDAECVSDKDATALDQSFASTSFPQQYERIVLVAYAPGRNRILVARRRLPPFDNFSSVLRRLVAHQRFKEIRESGMRLQLDFVERPPQPVDYERVGIYASDDSHFEIGIDGLIIVGPDRSPSYFLPGDAYVRSIMSMSQLRGYLGSAYNADWLHKCAIQTFRSVSFLCGKDRWVRLYRGIPVQGRLTKEKIEHALDLAISHIKRTQGKDGRFLYYYDAARDSCRDHEHPKRNPETNPYYNILRHAGGALTCLFYEKHTGRGDSLPTVRRALKFLTKNCRQYDLGGDTAAYVYYNRKAKLGGSGITLYLLCEYQLLTGDKTYTELAKQIGRHVISQITDNGEFLYYYIYLDKSVTAENNQEHFSFYYPGEAVCGLAKYFCIAMPEERHRILPRLKAALHFLLNVRPNVHRIHYTKVPSDSWLMMGINELWEHPEFRDWQYAEFVFNDADQMICQMYNVLDAPYPDYAGAFFYEFGDYPYADGARCEGLLAALLLAEKRGDENRASKYRKAVLLAAWALFHLVNDEDAVYSVPNPELSLGGIRFKYTRQWFRIDTIQHVASFYAKLLPGLERGE